MRSYRTFSPLPRLAALAGRSAGRYVFCGTFPRVTPGRRYRPPCPAEPGLSSPPASRREQRPPGPLRRLSGYSSLHPTSTLLLRASAERPRTLLAPRTARPPGHNKNNGLSCPQITQIGRFHGKTRTYSDNYNEHLLHSSSVLLEICCSRRPCLFADATLEGSLKNAPDGTRLLGVKRREW